MRREPRARRARYSRGCSTRRCGSCRAAAVAARRRRTCAAGGRAAGGRARASELLLALRTRDTARRCLVPPRAVAAVVAQAMRPHVAVLAALTRCPSRRQRAEDRRRDKGAHQRSAVAGLRRMATAPVLCSLPPTSRKHGSQHRASYLWPFVNDEDDWFPVSTGTAEPRGPSKPLRSAQGAGCSRRENASRLALWHWAGRADWSGPG